MKGHCTKQLLAVVGMEAMGVFLGTVAGGVQYFKARSLQKDMSECDEAFSHAVLQCVIALGVLLLVAVILNGTHLVNQKINTGRWKRGVIADCVLQWVIYIVGLLLFVRGIRIESSCAMHSIDSVLCGGIIIGLFNEYVRRVLIVSVSDVI
ncbi:unnamed protein product [Cuscuta europaea]|uniref:Uncharacterized protein n=1 Tax=Cuscuta europaea TaxID=41803 RepID=A0A9P0YKN0_CUSEU|nr:unnamed protein product [Cuscuta europaea]